MKWGKRDCPIKLDLKLSGGKGILEASPDGPLAAAAASALSATSKLREAAAAKIAERCREAARKEAGRVRREEECISAFKADFWKRRDEVLQACTGHSDKEIMASAERFLLCMNSDDIYYYPVAFDAEYNAIDPTMQTVVAALRRLGMGAADVLVWAYSLRNLCGYCTVGKLIEDMVSAPSGEYASPEVWAEVAEKLQRKLDALPDGESDDDQDKFRYNIEGIRFAWKRAGCEEKAIPYWLRYVERAGNWMETVELLNQFARFDEAIAVARKAIALNNETGEYGNVYCELMQSPLADAFAGKGDHAKAAAILAEQFLSWMGCYEYHRTVEMFRKVLDEAAKAGVGTAVRDALIQALKTGVNPVPLQEWKAKPPKEDYPWRHLPERVAYRAADALPMDPPWPLPRANEGVLLAELRWDTCWDWCQFDQEFLLKLAIAEGDKEEAARRFCDLPQYPESSSYYSHDVRMMLDDLEKLMDGYRPDIVEAIRDADKHWRSIKTRPCFGK